LSLVIGIILEKSSLLTRMIWRRSRVQGSGFRVQGSGFRVQGSGFRVQGSRFRVQGSGFKVYEIST
jgi:hypothetical protein